MIHGSLLFVFILLLVCFLFLSNLLFSFLSFSQLDLSKQLIPFPSFDFGFLLFSSLLYYFAFLSSSRSEAIRSLLNSSNSILISAMISFLSSWSSSDRFELDPFFFVFDVGISFSDIMDIDFDEFFKIDTGSSESFFFFSRPLSSV